MVMNGMGGFNPMIIQQMMNQRQPMQGGFQQAGGMMPQQQGFQQIPSVSPQQLQGFQQVQGMPAQQPKPFMPPPMGMQGKFNPGGLMSMIQPYLQSHGGGFSGLGPGGYR